VPRPRVFSDLRFAVRRWFPMCPVSGRFAEPRDPVNGATARSAVEDEQSEIALEVSLRVEELESEHLGVERDRVGTVEAGSTASSTIAPAAAAYSLSTLTARCRTLRSNLLTTGC
jgi:hypothetical protein